MSSLRQKINYGIYGAGSLFSLGLIRVPEHWRNHLPPNIDVASTASNLVPGIAIGVLAVELTQRLPKRERLYAAATAIAASALLNLCIENKAVNDALIVDEMHDIAGYGVDGEVRDIEHGIGGTAAGIVFSCLPITRRRRAVEPTPDSDAAIA